MVLEWRLDYFLGVCTKYLVRCGKKGPRKEDLVKAKWYLLRFMMEVEELSVADGVISPQEAAERLGVDGPERLVLIHILYRRYPEALTELQNAIESE